MTTTMSTTELLATLPARPRRPLAWVGPAAGKLVQAVVTLLLVAVCVFFATQIMPGNAATVLLGTHATPERVHALSQQLGLNDPVLVQFSRWFGGVLHGDFGMSLAGDRPVVQILAAPLGNSLFLAAVAVAIILPLSLLVGVLAARYRDGWFDRVFLGGSMVANALPDFIIGTLLVFLFGTTVFRILPAVSIIPIGSHPWDQPAKLVLPVLTLVIGGVMYLGRLVRAAVIDVLGSEYVEMAELKGVGRWRILLVHALPNALAPAIPAASLVAAFTVGGVVVTEYVFNYPGMGVLLLRSIGARDIPMIQAIVLIIAAIYFVFNFVADLVRVGGRG
ncbi:ABC transporter permease [Microbacterium sp. USTB-Y]|uniref:ABC transporter permease n=1 Tax=Microbacterium sp. USTB-Y TaxID=2823692 RepID=UPI00203A7285|nr:ABC transporter permease [Microbacterium sp. USTB-Y]